MYADTIPRTLDFDFCTLTRAFCWSFLKRVMPCGNRFNKGGYALKNKMYNKFYICNSHLKMHFKEGHYNSSKEDLINIIHQTGQYVTQVVEVCTSHIITAAIY